nr:ATP-binding protein [uncultured Arsenicibacter sp.]
MKSCLLFISLFWLMCHTVFSQVENKTKQIDSLRQVVVRHPKADTFRVNRLIDLTFAMSTLKWPPEKPVRRQMDSLLVLAIQLSQKINYPYGQAMANQALAALAYNAAQPGKAILYIKKALALARKSGDKKLISQLLYSLGYTDQSSPGQRQARFQEALVVARSSKDPELIFDTHTNIVSFYAGFDYPAALQWALPLFTVTQKDTNKIHQYLIAVQVAEIYTNLSDYDQALSYYSLSRKIARKRRDGMQEGASFCRMGELYLKKKEPDKAIDVLKKALPLEEGRREDWIVRTQVSLAEAYQQKRQYQQTYTFAYKALATMKESTFKYNYYYTGLRPVAWQALSQAHLNNNRIDSALYYAELCLPTVRDYLQSNALELPRDVSRLLAEVYAKKGNYAKAYTYQRQYMTFKDSLNNEEVARKATAERFKGQMSRQQGQITILQKDKQLRQQETRRQQQLLVTTLVVLVLLIGLALVLNRNNQNKQKANALLQAQRDELDQTLYELKNTQQQLIQKEKMASLGELTAGIAHEIQNPLNFVNNFSEVSTELIDELKEGPLRKLPESEQEYAAEIVDDLVQNLSKIHHHGKRADNIVKGMLEHSRSSTGQKVLTDINALASEYLKIGYHGLRAKDKAFSCELITRFDPVPVSIVVAPQELGRVLLNLYNNAFYAVSERGRTSNDADYKPTVEVTVNRQNERLVIRIKDNGTGIPESVKAKIFQPFFTTKPTGEGTGLGLSLSYDIITKGHGGTLRVESQAGEGAAFFIELPLR